MRFHLCPALLLAAAALWVAPATAGVKVIFANAKNYTDVDTRQGNTKGELRAYLQRLGAQLDPGLDLTVTFLDINLAGLDNTMQGPFGPRVLTGSTFPSLSLRYVLSRKGKTIASGGESLSDQLYLGRPGATRSGDPLRYEKNMLDDWFRSRFAEHTKRGG